ncbi:hypothetical protein C7212DRAFT_347571 [Tuber magnatum]|uniref:Hydrophobin n=1 Tax=Tuber magnatum TaxID=42249 RepID=A0A317SGC6_9PEZI|nr:hypothetical protein C7212DRAFT_347571 [Tuber magnatum]
MVVIKSLVVLLLAAAAAAIPVAGGDGHGKDINIKDSSVKCGDQKQELYCCNDDTYSKAVGKYVGVFEGINVKCNTVPVNAWWVVNVASSNKQCSAGTACCNSQADQNGPFSLVTGCVAPIIN